MTRIEKQLRAAGLNVEGIEFTSPREIEVAIVDADGDVCPRLTWARVQAIAQLTGWNGFRCGWGAWVLQKNYRSRGDFMDAGSAHHY